MSEMTSLRTASLSRKDGNPLTSSKSVSLFLHSIRNKIECKMLHRSLQDLNGVICTVLQLPALIEAFLNAQSACCLGKYIHSPWLFGKESEPFSQMNSPAIWKVAVIWRIQSAETSEGPLVRTKRFFSNVDDHITRRGEKPRDWLECATAIRRYCKVWNT